MSDYLEIIGQAGSWVIVLLVLVFLCLVYAVMRLIQGGDVKRDTDATKPKQAVATLAVDTSKLPAKTKVGTGNYKALVIRPGGIVDFNYIPEPIGEMYQADPSCPMHGGMFIVKELPNGEIIDYDPRKVKVDINKSPERAWFAINWDLVPKVYSVPAQWWQSTSTWWAIGLTVIMFIVVLVTLE